MGVDRATGPDQLTSAGARGSAEPVYPHHARPGRLPATVALSIAVILLALAYNGPWWYAQLDEPTGSHSAPGPTAQATATYDLGGSVSCSMDHWQETTEGGNPCANVSTQISGASRTQYVALDFVAVVLMGTLIVAAGLGAAGVLGVRFSRHQPAALLGLALGISLALSAVLVVSPVIGAVPEGQTTCAAWSAGATACPGFWGSDTAVKASPFSCADCYGSPWVTWGGGLAYGGFLGAAILGWVAFAVLFRGRKAPFTRPDEALWAIVHRPYTLVGPARAGGPDVETFVLPGKLPPPPELPTPRFYEGPLGLSGDVWRTVAVLGVLTVVSALVTMWVLAAFVYPVMFLVVFGYFWAFFVAARLGHETLAVAFAISAGVAAVIGLCIIATQPPRLSLAGISGSNEEFWSVTGVLLVGAALALGGFLLTSRAEREDRSGLGRD